MPRGVYRRVFLLWRYAIKTPRLRHFSMGLRSSRWEREMWFCWRPLFRWRTLCPVIWADPLGLLVIMPRASQPVPQEEVDALLEYYPDITAETKHEDFGAIQGQIVALDYGLPFADVVRERRNYYEGFGGKPAAELPSNNRL